MDLNEYLPMFLAESREHLQELNLAVVRVEEDPSDAGTIDEIFRAAHSLKGMSATMGFSRIAALTHAMEDLFEVLRQSPRGLDREAIDVLLECLDALSAAFEAIDTEGVERLDEEPLVVRLKALVVGQSQREPQAESTAAELPAPRFAERTDGRRLVHVVATLANDALMPSVRAFMVFAAVSDHGELLESQPPEDALEGFSGTSIEVWLATDHEDAPIESAVGEVPDIVSVAVAELTATGETPTRVAGAEDAGPAQAEPDSALAPTPSAAAVGETAVSAAAAEPPAGPVVPGEAVVEATPEPTAAPKKNAATSTVRVDSARLDQLMHLMGELVVHRTQVESLLAHSEAPGLQHAMNDLTRTSQELQTMVMQVRMIPVEAVFLRFPRLVRDLSSKLDKKVELQLTGADTELDRTVVDALGDPLVHLVRNSLDHGLEPVEEREAVGKPPIGTLEISARHAGGSVLITVRDDGRGIDPARVARKAAERGLIPSEAIDSIDLPHAVELLFAPGFSTAEEMSDVSGRGVGMDAVRSTIRELGGEVVMRSELGVGTSTEIRLPLTLAIVTTLVVESRGAPFAIQLDRVERTLKLEDYPARAVAGQRMLVLRDGVLPILDLAGTLGYGDSPDASYAVVVRGLDQRLVLAVDYLVGQRELVTRPLPDGVGARSALSGGAVLSNGQIALIVDCDALTGAVSDAATVANAA